MVSVTNNGDLVRDIKSVPVGRGADSTRILFLKSSSTTMATLLGCVSLMWSLCIIMISLSITAGLPGVRRGLSSVNEPAVSISSANTHPRVDSVTDAGQFLVVNDEQASVSGQRDGCDFKNDAQCQGTEDTYLRDDILQSDVYQALVDGLGNLLATMSQRHNQIDLESMTSQARLQWNSPSKLQGAGTFQTPGDSGEKSDGSRIPVLEDVTIYGRKWDGKEAFASECSLLFVDPTNTKRCQEQPGSAETLTRAVSPVMPGQVEQMPKDFTYFARVPTSDRPAGDVQSDSAHITQKRWRYLSNPVSMWERKLKAEYHRRLKLVKLLRDLMSSHMTH